MSLASWFSPTQNTTGTTNTTQSGTQQGQNQSNLWPMLSGYAAGYGSLSDPGAYNPYQTGAANNQAGVAGGLGQAFNTANYGAAGGLYNPGSSAAYMSPYLDSVASSTLGMQGLQKKQDLSNLRGGQAARGALGNNVGSEAAYLAGRAPADTQAINQIYNQGFNTANQNAQTAAGLQYQGANTAAGLTGAATGANQLLGQLGDEQYFNKLKYGMQFGQGWAPYNTAAGANYSGSNFGTSIGQNNSTTTTTPSPWQIASGIGGMALGMFADGGRVPSYAMGGGMPGGLMSLPGMGGIMDVMKSKDMPAGGLSSLGDMGSLGSMGLPFARGGGVGSSFADKVMHAHHVLKRMQGGRANFDEGGGVGNWTTDLTMGSMSPGDADRMVDTAMANPNGGQSQPSWSQKLGGALTKAGQIGGGNSGNDATAKANAGAIDALNRSRSDLTAFMAQNNPLKQAQGFGYADGGMPGYEGGGMPGDPMADDGGLGLGAPTPFERGLERLGLGESNFAAPTAAKWSDAGPGETWPPPSYAGLHDAPVPRDINAPMSPAGTLNGYPSQPQSGFLGGLRNFVKGTAYDYDAKPTGSQNFSRALMNQSGDLVAGKMGATLGEIEKERVARDQQRIAQIRADQEWAQLSGKMPGGGNTLAAQTALGTVDGQQTLAAARQAEEIRHKNLPQWVPGAGGKDFWGDPIGAWVQPNQAPPESQYQPPRGGAAPSAAPRGANQAAPDYSKAAYAPTKDAVAQIPSGQLYFTPEHVSKGLPPEVKQEAGAASPQQTAKDVNAPAGAERPPPGTAPARTAPGVYVPGTSNADSDLMMMRGPEFLTALEQRHPAQAAVVKGILRGDIPPNDPRVRGKQGQQYLAWANQADENFSNLSWQQRMQATKAMGASGPYGQKFASAGMLIGHLDALADQAEKLHNWPYVPPLLRKTIANPFAEQFETGTGGMAANLNDYRLRQGNAAKELTSFLAGKGGGTLDELHANEARFDPSLGGPTLKQTIGVAIDQMRQRLIEMASQYNQAHGTSYPPEHWLAPEHRAVLKKLEERLAGKKEGAPDAGWTVKRVE